MLGMSEEARVIHDILEVVYGDSWIWGVCHGQPRCGKSTLCMQIAYELYKDWDKVLNCIVFNLPQLLYKMKAGEPERWPTRNKLHMRVPLVIWDDFAAYSNKAITQHDPAWDDFKGCFDTLATKIAVILANMVSPTSPTQQLQEKFNAELWIPYRGYYKYDIVKAGQDYHGFRPQVRKSWEDEGWFEPIPWDVFKSYDELRMSLADEKIQSVESKIVDTHLDSILKRVQPLHMQILRLIRSQGLVHRSKVVSDFGDEAKDALTWLKSHQLVISTRVGSHYYRLDVTDLGDTLLKTTARPLEAKPSTVSTY